MISQLTIKNFKSHAFTELALSNINVLSGINGMGKSSVIQALLLLRQTNKKGMLDKGLELKDDLCNIGVARDALYQSADNDKIIFSLTDTSKDSYYWSFKVDDKKLSDTFLKIDKFEKKQLSIFSKEVPHPLFGQGFQYLSAFRTGPVQDYEKDTSAVEMFSQISKKEGRCELVAHYLDFYKNDTVALPLLKAPDDDPSLLFQVKRWLEDISPGINIHTEALESSYRLNYSFSRGSSKTPTDKFKALNIGFGISYVLPIVVAALHATRESLIIIENPEAHIHPAGQAKLMELICRAAREDVQFIIETHSDHIINGLLISVKNQLLAGKDSKVFFFDRDVATHATKVTELPVLPGGKIKHPPKGFFDQINSDMEKLMGF